MKDHMQFKTFCVYAQPTISLFDQQRSYEPLYNKL